MQEESKMCKVCKRLLPLTAFHRDKARPDGRSWSCRECKNQWMRDHFDLAESKEKRRNWDLKKLYRISREQVEQMILEQEGCCAICGEETEDFHVDHNHQTGKVRRLLCFKCNSLLGMARESIKILYAAIEYLERYDCKASPSLSDC